MSTQGILALISFLLCSVIGFVCVCRLNAELSRKFPVVRTRYTLLMLGATAYGFQPLLFSTYPNVAGILLTACVLTSLVPNIDRWIAANSKSQHKPV